MELLYNFLMSIVYEMATNCQLVSGFLYAQEIH